VNAYVLVQYVQLNMYVYNFQSVVQFPNSKFSNSMFSLNFMASTSWIVKS